MTPIQLPTPKRACCDDDFFNRLASYFASLNHRIAELTARHGRSVNVEQLGLLDRRAELKLGETGQLTSPNGTCRMFQVADGWMALNLARHEDRDLIPSWLGCDFDGDPWTLIDNHRTHCTSAELVERGRLLGLPMCRVGEATSSSNLSILRGSYPRSTRGVLPRVVDLSALWAGPLCGAILAEMGAKVTRIESRHRPDNSREATPNFYQRLNHGKTQLVLDLAAVEDRERLHHLILEADIVITSARPRGLASIGLDPDHLLSTKAGLVWVAVTGYGLGPGLWAGPSGNRVAFGDDAAAAAGLVSRTADGEPRFAGDALADPLTGMVAAIGALLAIDNGGGTVVDAGLAPIAAQAATACRGDVSI